MKRWAKPSTRFTWRLEKIRLSCAWAAISEERLWRSRTPSSRLPCSLAADGPPNALAARSSEAVSPPTISNRVTNPDIPPPSFAAATAASRRLRGYLLRLLRQERLEVAELAEQRIVHRPG